MRRGEIWTAAGGEEYGGKPRPVVIVQDDRFDTTRSITLCAFTSTEIDAPMFRVLILPGPQNGLEKPSWLMVDKLFTVPRDKLGYRVGQLDREDMVQLNRAIMIFLALPDG